MFYRPANQKGFLLTQRREGARSQSFLFLLNKICAFAISRLRIKKKFYVSPKIFVCPKVIFLSLRFLKNQTTPAHAERIPEITVSICGEM